MAKAKKTKSEPKLYRVASRRRNPIEDADLNPRDKRFQTPAVQLQGLLSYLENSDDYNLADIQGNGTKAHVYIRDLGKNGSGFISVRARENALLDGTGRVHLRIGGSTETAKRIIVSDIRHKKGYTIH
ncbi:hypothetical protein CMI47_11665 [Candidatus Pacearchaeota archaeon]|nr:hypothetical protein [Candidatus Pacearchaeota archaeon]|tara:strand:- start:10382 stop:10765 length:384 start_codon:yes stop_codon:yes gene_type:complete